MQGALKGLRISDALFRAPWCRGSDGSAQCRPLNPEPCTLKSEFGQNSDLTFPCFLQAADEHGPQCQTTVCYAEV